LLKSLLKSFQIFSQLTALIQTKDHSNVSSAEWTSVPTLMHRLRTRLAETLMSTGDQSYRRIFTVDQTHFAEVVGCPCCGFRRYFVSNSQVIGCEDRLRNDLYCVGWGVKLYSINRTVAVSDRSFVHHPRLRRRRHRSLLEDGHSMLRCGRPCCDSWRPRTASVYTHRCHSD